MYNQIYEFCKVKNLGTMFSNGATPTPRVEFIMSLLNAEGIDFDLDIFTTQARQGKTIIGYNIIMRGSSDKMVVAHHDIVNPKSDNANDNSCSVINAIALKKLLPEVNVVLTDGEELGGIGAQRLSTQVKAGEFGEIAWILNLELTGRGGKSFLICAASRGTLLHDIIKSRFEDCLVIHVPFNDSVIFRRNGIDSVNINPLPREADGAIDLEPIFLCHSEEDSLDKISIEDMQVFVEEVLAPICRD